MRLFISYAHTDLPSIQRLAAVLRDVGYDPWFDERLVAGREWKEQLRESIAAADVFVYALTPDSVKSEWCEWEFVTAIKLGKPVLPLLLEDVKLPQILAEIQYLDLRTGLRKRKVQKLLADLSTLVATIPAEQAPSAPAEPSGTPARAVNVEQHVSIGDVSGGSVSVIGYIGTQILGDRQRNWTIPVILTILIALVGSIAAVLALFPQAERDHALHSVGLLGPSATPTHTPTASPTPTSTPTPAPERMPADAFNVVVAGFGYEQSEGAVTRDPLADDMSDIVYNAVADLAQVDFIQGWRNTGIGHILSADPLERERQAARIASALNADVVIYGLVRDTGIRGELEPEFYISAQYSNLEPELQGADAFGEAIGFVTGADGQETASTELQRRLAVLRDFLRGLSLYLLSDFDGATAAFSDALDEASEGLEVINIFAGNAALRNEDRQQALDFYNAALAGRPDYSRALMGRGGVLYQMTLAEYGVRPPPYDPDLELLSARRCSDTDNALPEEPQLRIELALRCFDEAERSDDKPQTADIDVKNAFGLGQLRLWQSLVGYGEHWDVVKTRFETVIDLYHASGPERQARIRGMAAHAHAYLGVHTIETAGSSVEGLEQALGYYETAVMLLQTDVNVEYNQSWIDTYTRQIESLDTALRQRGVVRTPSPTPAPTPTERGAEFK